MALRADTKTGVATIHKIALYMGNGSFCKHIKRDRFRAFNNHTGRAIVGRVGNRLIYQKLLAYHPPDMTFLRQFSFEPAGEFSCAAISILDICIIKSYIDSHFLSNQPPFLFSR